MVQNITRMQFLRGDIKGKTQPIRPPWALPEKYFVDFCTRCDACIDACFDNLIIKGRGGFPQMDFSREGCDFCEDCLHACEPGALKKLPAKPADNHTHNVLNQTIRSSINHLNEEMAAETAQSVSNAYLPPWDLKAEINKTTCLSMHGTICRTCAESCDFAAIRFKLELGGIAEPLLDLGKCTGCGSCYGSCPVHSITIKTLEKRQAVA